MFKCKTCLKEFKLKHHLNNHLNRKIKCYKIEDKKVIIEEPVLPTIILNKNHNEGFVVVKDSKNAAIIDGGEIVEESG